MYAIRIGDVFTSGKGRMIVCDILTKKEVGEFEEKSYLLGFADGSQVWVKSNALRDFQRLKVNVFFDDLHSERLEDTEDEKKAEK